MKITKRQLRRIIKEMHPRAAADDAYVAELERQEDELATQIRNASKDVHGRKDVYDLEGKSVEELEDILYDLANSQEQQELDDMARGAMEDQLGRDQELSRAEMAPRRQGMSRRPGGSKSQRRMEGKLSITKRQLRSIIREAMDEISMYDQGREDSFAGIRPQFPNGDYMMGYNEAQLDAGLPKMQAPSDSGRGKKLDPSKLKGAFAGKYYRNR